MFAVPGWKVSVETLLSRKADVSSADQKQANESQGTASVPASKKRKRLDDPSIHAQKISTQDLDQLWNKQFKKTPDKSHGTSNDLHSKQKAKKSRRRNSASEGTLHLTPTGLVNVEATNTNQNRLEPQSEKANRLRKDSPPKKDKARFRNEQGPRRASIDRSDSGGKKSSSQAHENATSHFRSGSKDSKPILADVNLASAPPKLESTSLTPLQAKMRNKLTSARFRHLNQTLYTTSSSAAMQLFSNSPELFEEYHAGFSQQVKQSWPQNPVDTYIREIKRRGPLQQNQFAKEATNLSKLPLPRRIMERCTIADLGCGDAPLARGCQSEVKSLNLKFHNFDLHSPINIVAKADIANLPLRDGEVDIAVFCLSLMGTNWPSFVEEAWRILRGDGKGEVWVAEVKSRFARTTKGRVVENSVGKKKKPKSKKIDLNANTEDVKINGEELFVDDDRDRDQEVDQTDVNEFIRVFERRGFIVREESIDKSNKMFVTMIFVKSAVPTAGRFKGMKWNGRDYGRVSNQDRGRMKFIEGDKEGDISPEDEVKVLKPCVYKTR